MSKDTTTKQGAADAKAEHYAACKTALEEIESKAQAKWALEKSFETEAPATFDPANKNKFFVTFPYPYMNGMLHIGHAFSVSKSEFAVRYNRLKGRHVLWPFGLHVTGTPIAACAQKLQSEMKMYGTPPVFPEEVLNPEVKPQAEVALAPGQYKAKRMKVAKGKPQWQIMQGMDIADSEIPKFADSRHWLDTFPALCLEDCKSLGLHIDYRRSFITTSENPFYDRFIKWQFRKLREANYLKWGKRYCIYSPLDGQPCADHDRASGEGVQPQEYTVVKLIVQNPLDQPAFAEFKDIIGDKQVALPGATLRAETVVGQTNCWVSPTIRYAAFEVRSAKGVDQIQVMTTKCARNMAYQGILINGKVDYDPVPLFEVDGDKMLGLPLSAPHAPFATIYTLPMATITEAKGTGVVMSVPSDSPDDYINFIQLVKKPEYRAKLNLKDEWVTSVSITPILNIPDSDLGENSAERLIEKLKIQGPKDADKLEEAKKEAYSQGFYKGIMTIGPFKGKKVVEAKVLMAELMTENDEAFNYREPMKEVMSRSGDVCVVALCDQWFLEYGKEEWKAAVKDHLEKNVECYFHGIRNGFDVTLEWLSDWPCSRSFGLGTVLPFNKEDMIIDSLSDSTIYMAYYTMAHYLHHPMEDGSLNLDGTKPNKYNLTPDMFTDATFDYVLKGVGTPADCPGMPKDIAEQMRAEFAYWYPVDLRVSGKELIQNHLTMFLYNHAAIWPEDNKLWPKSIYCNGHVQVDGEKMSKSKGNSISLREGIQLYSTDALRLTLADAGDSLDDGNFVRDNAKGFVLKLSNLIESFSNQMAKVDQMRTGEYNLYDKIFDNSITQMIKVADGFYAGMSFRSAMNQIFFESAKDEGFYTLATAACKPHAALINRYIETMALLLSPITPHASEHIWTNILKKEESIMKAVLKVDELPAVDLALQQAGKIINDVISEIRAQAQKVAKKRGKIDEVNVYVATEYLPWQIAGLEALQKIYEANNNSFPMDTTKQIQASKAEWLKGNMQEIMSFIAFTRDNVIRCGPAVLAPTPLVDEKAVLTEALAFVQSHSGVATVIITPSSDESIAGHAQARGRARPAQPSVALPIEEKKK